MSDWTDGYLSDVTYPVQFYRQTTPAWLAMAAILSGHRPPRLDRRFRWCDLGCGQGFTALGVAACHPEAEIFAFDFNPSHIENARRMAAAAGLTNTCLEETSFEELATSPPGAYPKMDFIVLHGIWTWVSTTQRAHLIAFIRDHLAPGGLVYVAYNALAGWAAVLPVQKLLRLLRDTEQGTGDEVVTRGMAFLQEFIGAGAEFFIRNPVVTSRLEFLGQQHTHYLSHELMHASWDPTPFDAVARDMDEAKCSFIGSATLLENLDAFSVPPAMVPILARTADIRVREAIRDFGSARMFRRDLYRRGSEKPLPGELVERFDALVLTDLGREDQGDIKIHTWGEHGVGLHMEVYAPILQRLRNGKLNMGDLRRALGDFGLAQETLAVLAATNIAHPTPFAEPPSGHRATALNGVIADYNRQGGEFLFQMSPLLGTGLVADAIETMIVQEYDGDRDDTVERLLRKFQASGRTLFQDGKPVTEPEWARAGWRQIVDNFIRQRLEFFRRAGVV